MGDVGVEAGGREAPGGQDLGYDKAEVAPEMRDVEAARVGLVMPALGATDVGGPGRVEVRLSDAEDGPERE